MLEFRVQKRVGALDLDVSLAASDETMLIAGPNGAGKSTLLRLLLGVLRPDGGRIALEGSALFDSGARVDAPPESRRLGYVPQDYALFPHLDVEENVAFGLAALPRPERRRRVAEWLSRLELLPLARRSPSSLSGGERQRVALARALAPEPRALLLDEPFASLDPGARRDLRVSLRGWLRGWRLPALMVSHDPADAAAADRIAVVERGRLVQQGTLDELRKAPATEFVSAFQAVGA